MGSPGFIFYELKYYARFTDSCVPNNNELEEVIVRIHSRNRYIIKLMNTLNNTELFPKLYHRCILEYIELHVSVFFSYPYFNGAIFYLLFIHNLIDSFEDSDYRIRV